MMRHVLVSLAVVVSVVLGSALGHATTYWASPTGGSAVCANISSPGIGTDPGVYGTLAFAISCATSTAPDTVVAKIGTYVTSLDNPFSNTGTSWANAIVVRCQSITFPATPACVIAPTSMPSGAAVYFGNATQQYGELNGFDLDASGTPGNKNCFQADTITTAANHLRLRNFKAHHCNNQGLVSQQTTGGFNEFINGEVYNIAHNGTAPTTCNGSGAPLNGYCHGFYIYSPGNLIDHVEFHHINGAGGQFYGDPCTATGNSVRNSKMHDNVGPGVFLICPSSEAINNLIYNNADGGLDLAVNGGHLVQCNTVYNNTGAYGGLTVSGVSATVQNNIFRNNAVTGVTPDGTNLTTGTDPLFVSPGTGDFHLQSSSPAIGIGATIAACTPDRDGVSRTVSYDAGAFEFVAAGSTNANDKGLMLH